MVERELSPILARHYAAISLNARLFTRVAALYDQRESLSLTAEQARLLELTYKSFILTGARLEGADRVRFAEIAEKLAGLELQFAQNVLADENNYVLALDEADLSGVPADVKAAAAQAARDCNAVRPFAFTLSHERRALPEPCASLRSAGGIVQRLDCARRT